MLDKKSKKKSWSFIEVVKEQPLPQIRRRPRFKITDDFNNINEIWESTYKPRSRIKKKLK